jgi:hypothetical protein
MELIFTHNGTRASSNLTTDKSSTRLLIDTFATELFLFPSPWVLRRNSPPPMIQKILSITPLAITSLTEICSPIMRPNRTLLKISLGVQMASVSIARVELCTLMRLKFPLGRRLIFAWIAIENHPQLPFFLM